MMSPAIQKPTNRATAPKIRSITPAGLVLGFFSLAGFAAALAGRGWGGGGACRAERPARSTCRAARSMGRSIWAIARSTA